MNVQSRLCSYIKPHRRMLIFSVVTASLYGLVCAAPPYFLKYAVDDIFIQRHSQFLLPLAVLFASVFVLKGVLMYVSGYAMHAVNNRMINTIRSDLFKSILRLPTSFFEDASTGSLMSHFLNDVSMIQQAAASAIKEGIRSIFETVALIGFAFYLNYKLSFLMLIVGPLLGFTIKRLGAARKRASLAIQHEMAKISSTLQESFTGVREIKAFNGQDKEVERFDQQLTRCFTSIMYNIHVECLAPASIEMIAMGGCAVVFYVAALQVIDGIITAGQLSSFGAAIILAYQPLKKIVNVYAEAQYGLAAAERVFAIMDRSERSQEEGRIVRLPAFTDQITWNAVAVGYRGKAPVIKDVSFSVFKGQSIGIIGPSGAGKSTFCDLLLGFLVPQSGTMCIDGIDVSTITLQSLREHVGYVSQRSFLFNDTIANNVAYAKSDATRDQVIQACKAAHAHEFICQLEHGYDTWVGENGMLLSGGQKQRITIARALLKNPEILIFDEATSALDEESQAMIRLTVQELSGRKTLFIVSHRPTMLYDVDRLLLVDAQRVVEIAQHARAEHLSGYGVAKQIG